MEKILLVNDSYFENIVMQDMLHNIGYETVISDEFNVLNKFNTFRPDMVITNLIMKAITGDKLIQTLKESSPNLICILCTSSDIDLNTFTDIKIDGIIKIPFKENDLNSVVKSLLDKKENPVKTNFKFCPFCGKKFDRNENSYKFCPDCGNNISK